MSAVRDTAPDTPPVDPRTQFGYASRRGLKRDVRAFLQRMSRTSAVMAWDQRRMRELVGPLAQLLERDLRLIPPFDDYERGPLPYAEFVLTVHLLGGPTNPLAAIREVVGAPFLSEADPYGGTIAALEDRVFNESRLYDALGKEDARSVLGIWNRLKVVAVMARPELEAQIDRHTGYDIEHYGFKRHLDGEGTSWRARRVSDEEFRFTRIRRALDDGDWFGADDTSRCTVAWYEDGIFNPARLAEALGCADALTVLRMWERFKWCIHVLHPGRVAEAVRLPITDLAPGADETRLAPDPGPPPEDEPMPSLAARRRARQAQAGQAGPAPSR